MATSNPLLTGVGTTSWGGLQGALADQLDLKSALDLKADAAATTSALNSKADAAATNNALSSKADDAATTAALDLKAPLSSLVDRPRIGSGAPTGGNSGDYYVRMDPPFLTVLYKNTAGTWAVVAPATYTWAARPSAATSTGCVITISDWGQDFVSDGTNWIPVNKSLVLVNSGVPTAAVTGTGTNAVIVTDTIPAGLVITGCRIEFEALFLKSGTTAVFTPKISLSGVDAYQLATTVAANVSASVRNAMWIADQVTSVRMPANAASATGYYQQSAAESFSSLDFTAARPVDFRFVGTSPDTVRVTGRRIVITFP